MPQTDIGSRLTDHQQRLRAGMVGIGMIFDETYRPFFEQVRREGLYDRRFGLCEVELAAVASRTGQRAEAYRKEASNRIGDFVSFAGPDAVGRLLDSNVDFVCVATPDNRHFDSAMAAIQAGKHVLIEKPSVLSLEQLDQLAQAAVEQQKLVKVVYHKLLDPDHKKLRTLVLDGVLRHVNHGYCSLLEPKSISTGQFSEWITGRNPASYVAVHYIKLIDFTFGGRLQSVACSGQRGLVGPIDGSTWDSTQLRLTYQFDDGRSATFDIHTGWVTPENFPGYVEQEVQFRFDNGVWNGHSRKRGVECTVEGITPLQMKTTLNNHYNGKFEEPFGGRTQRGYGIEVIERFAREVAYVQFGKDPTDEADRLQWMRQLDYNDLSADRQVVAAVQALEAILDRAAIGKDSCVVQVNGPMGGLVLYEPGGSSHVLYAGQI